MILLLVLMGGADRAVAEPIKVGPLVPDLSRQPELRIESGELKLSLDEAIAIALERNLSLIVQRYFQEQATLTVKQNLGIYDVFSTVDLATLEETSPAASNLDGADVQEFEQQRWDFGFDQLVPSGGTVFLDWRNNRQETNSLFATLNPSYRIDLDLTFTQPLLRDMGRLATERNLTISRTNRDISRENFELQVTSVILQVEDAYWNLAEARAQLQVAEESLALAKQLHEQNQIRVEVGTLAPLELVQSEAGVAVREVEIIRARAAVGDRADVLRQLLNLERQGDLWALPVVPTSDPFADALEVDLDQAISTALASRPEIRRKNLALQNQQLDVDYFRNQRRPRLDLALSYGLNGVGGDVTDRDLFTGEVLSEQSGDYGDAIDQILDGDFDGWRVALNFAYPIQNRTASAQSAIADVSFERGQAELDDLELGVVTEVRRVARALEASAEAVESAEVSRRLEEKNYEAEQKRYENGMSTSFQVLQIQEDLSDARSRYVTSVATYRRALALHYQSIGKLIDKSGVEIVSE
jgi:outer membrane protein TolC